MSRRLAFALAATLAAAPAQGEALPDWLEQAVLRSAPSAGRASAIVLHDEQIVRVHSRGLIDITTRQAVRIITPDARGLARATANYLRGTSVVTRFETWTIGPAGNVLRRAGRGDAADVSGLQSTQLATDSRRLVFSDDAIEPGQTFAWEIQVEEQPLIAQWKWLFRSRYPCALSRFELRLPGDVDLDVRVHSAHLDSALTGHPKDRWTWELRDQPAAANEPYAPARPDLNPYLCVQAVPPKGDRSPAGIAFRDWPSVSRWIDELAAGQDAVTPRIAETVARIAGGSPDSLARIREIARYVQGLNYVAVEVNTGRGWGARPNTADAVLVAGHGDCKDKANLLRAMLHAAGHEAWLMPIYSGNRDRVDTAWADLAVQPLHRRHSPTRLVRWAADRRRAGGPVAGVRSHGRAHDLWRPAGGPAGLVGAARGSRGRPARAHARSTGGAEPVRTARGRKALVRRRARGHPDRAESRIRRAPCA